MLSPRERRTVELPKVVLGQSRTCGEDASLVHYQNGGTFLLARITDEDLDEVEAAKSQLMEELTALDMTEVTMFMAQVGRACLEPRDRRREEILEHVSQTTGLSREMLALDFRAVGTFLAHRAFTFDMFGAELGDEWAMDEWQRVQASSVKAYPRGIVVHGLVGNIPMAGLGSIVRGLITRNMNLAKTPRRDPLSSIWLAELMAGIDPDHPLTRGLTVGYWEHEDEVGERAINIGDAVCLWGNFESIRAMRRHARVGASILEFGPRRSLAVVDLDRIDDDMDRLAARLATEVTFYDQEACLSPQQLFVKGDFQRLKPLLVHYLEVASRRAPKITSDRDALAHVSFARLEADYRGWPVTSDADWSVIEVPDAGAVVEHPLGRTLYVHSVASLDDVTPHLNDSVQTLGVYPYDVAHQFRERWARCGITRIVELGLSRHPRKGFSHDGLRPLQALVRWVSAEGSLYDYYKYLDAPRAGAEDELFFRA